jgi:hypothetical protein
VRLPTDDVALNLTTELLREGLVPCLVPCLAGSCAEVRRLSVVTLAAVSRCDALVGSLAVDSAALEGLRTIADASAETDPRLEKQAREPMKNAEEWSLLQRLKSVRT